MWQFAEVVRGLADGCTELGTPVTGGNVSFYNQTGDTRDPPDARGRRARRARRRLPPHPLRLAGGGQALYLLGTTREELSGSAWADVVHDHLGGLPPRSTSTSSGCSPR